MSLSNSILAGNVSTGFGGRGRDCETSSSAQILSEGHNLIGSLLDCSVVLASGDLTNVDPILGPLQDNGGPTLTHALQRGSPAIDAAGVSCTSTDQRGVLRPKDGDGDGLAFCDIGAFELEEAPPNQPPVALCRDVIAAADANCLASVDVDNGSFDPDGDPVTVVQDPPGPYGLGDTLVTLVPDPVPWTQP